MQITAKINGREFTLWNRIHISKSLFSMSHLYSIVSSNVAAGDPNWWDVKMEDEIILALEDAVVLKGVIETIEMDYTGSSGVLLLNGRDALGDIVDSSYVETANEWRNQTIRSLFTTLCGPYGIQLDFDSSVSNDIARTISLFKADEGDSISDLITRVCRDYGLLPISRGKDNKLTITKTTTNVLAPQVLQSGVNISRAQIRSSNIDRYSHYIAKGTGIGSDTQQITDFSAPYGEVTDTVVKRYRPHTILCDGPVDSGICLLRARSEASKRAGNSRKLFYTVSNWVQSDGTLWDVDILVSIEDSIYNVHDTMLIDSIDFITDKHGAWTVIGVVDKRTYQAGDNASRIKGKFDV